MSLIERTLNNILQEATAVKFLPLKNACKEALDLLESYNCPVPTHEVRQKSLNCIQIALESKRTRFQAHGISALQKLIVDERFLSSIEPENEDYWIANQILNAVKGAPFYHENTQIEIMKVLLQLTLSQFWFANQKTVIKIAEVCLDTYSSTNQESIRVAIRATFTQTLTAFSERIFSSQAANSTEHAEHVVDSEINDLLGERSLAEPVSTEELDNVVTVLRFLCDELFNTATKTPGKTPVPLLLIGIHSLLVQLPTCVKKNEQFVDVLWKQLCPSLIVIIGNPVHDKPITNKSDIIDQEASGRGSGCSANAPNLDTSSMNALYSIVIELVKFVGDLRSFRPVLESVFHRMLLYPPPQHRRDALKAIKEVLGCSEKMMEYAGPTIDDSSNSTRSTDSNKLAQTNTGLLKIIIDSAQEGVHCDDVNVLTISVSCVHEFLKSIEEICRGEHLSEENIEAIMEQFPENRLPLSPKQSERIKARMQRTPERTTKSVDVQEKGEDILTISTDGSVSLSDSQEKEVEVVQEKKNKTESEHNSFEKVESRTAQEYVNCLAHVLPSLLDAQCGSEMDETLRTFSSHFCAGQRLHKREEGELVFSPNADDIYLISYHVLYLHFKMKHFDCLRLDSDSTYSMTFDEFLSTKTLRGKLFHLPEKWLREVYKLVTTTDILQTDASEQKYKDSVLCTALVDLVGLEGNVHGGQFRKSYREDSGMDPSSRSTPAADAGARFARYVLALCWDGILDILSVSLNGKSAFGLKSSVQMLLGMDGAREENVRAREAACISLEGLQRAATLACFLGLHQRCSTVFGQLAHASCMIEDYQQSSPHVERSNKVVDAIINRPKMPRLHSAHALSLDMVLNSGMEIGSHARDCWYHVFRCCLYVNRLEHIYFSRHTTTGPRVLKQETQVDDPVEELAPSAPVMPVPVSIVPDISISHIMGEGQDEENKNIGLDGVLNLEKTSKVICHLSQAVDHLFEDVSDKLTTKALIEFLGELCKSSEEQLAELSKVQSKEELNSTNVLLIYRLGDVMLRAIGHDRPLVHVMKCWSVVAPHLIDAAGHRDHIISKKAVSCLHESITALLSAFKELPHFYFNDFFCKPFEDLLCMELCDGDVQDQIVCSICELVEACPDEIGSGWRPLFASLRAVKIEFTASEEVNEARQRHVATVLDVFDVFINLDNVLVFSNAAVNCILCLLKYVRGPGAFEPEEDDSDDEFDPNISYRTENLVSPALHYLQLCSNILAKMWHMPACPVIAGATIGLTNDEPRTVDPIIPDLLLNECQRVLKSELVYSKDSRPPDHEEEDDDAADEESESENTPKHSVEKISSIAQVRATCEGKRRERALSEGKIETHYLTSGIEIKYQPQTLDDIDNHTGVLHVWFMMLEGLSNAVSASPKTFQPQTVDMLFELLQGIAEDPGPPFCLHCLNHLYLPILQDWMRRSAQEKGYWQGHINNFKQCVGLTADLVVDYIKKFLPTHELMVELLLKQFLDILVECISQPVEPISRLGTSCIRHILLSGGAGFTESLWNVATRGILHAFRVSTVCLQQLIILFERHSDSFTGDFGGVKVAARKDCTVDDNERLTHLAWQVFLLDCQKNAVRRGILDMDSDKSYIFLLYPPEHADSVNPDHIFARVPFRSMVVGLLSHQLLLQIVGRLILGNQGEEGEHKAFPETPKLFSSRCILTLLQCLQESYKLARQFDTRPGMKFLIQKVARATVAANLYRQTGVSMTLLVECLFKLVTCETHDVEYIRDILTSGIENLVKESVIKPYDISINHGDMAEAMISSENYGAHLEVYVKLLFETCCEICDTYVDLVSQKEQTSRADKLSQQPLFFIVAKPDELDVKLERSTSTNSEDQESIKNTEPVIETLHYSTVTIQGQPDNATNENEELEKSRGNLRNRVNSTGSDIVYDVATHHTLEKLMSEYKRRKLQNAMPSAHKQKRGPLSPTGLSPRDALIEKEQNESIIKDSEAHVQSLTELACTLISNMEQLDDKKFQMLLPVVMPSVSQLVRLADDARLRKALGDWLMRLGNVYQITAK